jgi:hypothetical protein
VGVSQSFADSDQSQRELKQEDRLLISYKVVAYDFLLVPNAALSGAPKGHPSPVPGSPRSVAEGRSRHHRSAPHSPRSEAEGGTQKSAAVFTRSAGLFGYDLLHQVMVLAYANMAISISAESYSLLDLRPEATNSWG